MVWIFKSHTGKASLKTFKLGVVSLIKLHIDTTYIFMGDKIQQSFSAASQIKKIKDEPGYKISYEYAFKLFRFADPVVELRNMIIKSMGIGKKVTSQKSLATSQKSFLNI